LTFYGLNDEYKLGIYEEFFQLKYWGGWSFFEAYNLPVVIRRWFLSRLSQQKTKEADEIAQATKATSSGGRSFKGG
jgi:hypothetical protein